MTPSDFQWRFLKTRVTVATLVIFLAGIWALAFYASRLLREDMESHLSAQQFSTVSVIAAQVNQALEDRLRVLEKVAGIIDPAILGNTAALQKLLDQRLILQGPFNAGVMAVGRDGRVIAETPPDAGRIGVNYLNRDSIVATFKEGKATISPPLIDKTSQAPVFDMTAPIRDARGTVIGALVGVTHLEYPNFLGQIAQNSYGRTGGYLLIERHARQIITATDKKRIMEVFPAPGVIPLLDRFLQGDEGSGIATNPHGVEVLASARSVPAAGWLIAATLPTSEAFAPIRRMQRHMLLAAIFLSLLGAAIVWRLLRLQLGPLLAAVQQLAGMSDQQQAWRPLPVARPDEIGELIGGFNRLLDAVHEHEAALYKSEENYRTLFREMLDGLAVHEIICDRQGNPVDYRFLAVNPAFVRMTGLRAEDIVGRTVLEVMPETERYWIDAYGKVAITGEPAFFENYSAVFKKHFKVTALRPAPHQFVCIFSDITARKRAEDEIRTLAFYDPLTRLPNRRLLLDRLELARHSSARHQREGALLFIDLDNFKTLNDTLGHDIGDLLLQQVAQRLVTCVREGDTVARLGGDEFVVMLEDLSENLQEAASQAENVGQKILVTLNLSYQLAGRDYHSSPSIGVTLFGDHLESIEEPLRRADMAMYQAKASGRNTLRFFDPEMQAAVNARAALEAELREAVAKNQFILHYQAQMTDDGHLTGAEALLRWQHPQRGVVMPAEFIAAAEDGGIIVPLGQWVLETVCAQLALWAARPETAQLTVAVNVSARQFRQRDFVPHILALLERSGANPQRLRLELTESLLAANVEELVGKMEALKEKGVSFALDDLGTGYSSLSYLKRLPLDQLKIDQGFVADILTDANAAIIARMVVALGGSMGLCVIAEGVETEAQRDFLARQGCTAYQGYLFARPLPLAGFEELVCRRTGTSTGTERCANAG